MGIKELDEFTLKTVANVGAPTGNTNANKEKTILYNVQDCKAVAPTRQHQTSRTPKVKKRQTRL